MQLKQWLNKDEYSLGILLGLIIPVPAAFVFTILLRLAQNYLHVFERVRDMDLLLLGLAVNLLVMRYYLVKRKFEKTGKSLMILTVVLIIAFLIFLKNSIPLMYKKIRNNKPLPVYGKGDNIRDWLFVEDHARAMDTIFHNGKQGEKYNIGGFNEWKNIDLVHLLCRIMDNKLGREEGTSAKLITYVTDRPGHDQRYAIDATKLNKELGWSPSLQFEEGLEKTVEWYLANEEWVDHVTSGNYKNYYEDQYQNR